MDFKKITILILLLIFSSCGEKIEKEALVGNWKGNWELTEFLSESWGNSVTALVEEEIKFSPDGTFIRKVRTTYDGVQKKDGVIWLIEDAVVEDNIEGVWEISDNRLEMIASQVSRTPITNSGKTLFNPETIRKTENKIKATKFRGKVTDISENYFSLSAEGMVTNFLRQQ